MVRFAPLILLCSTLLAAADAVVSWNAEALSAIRVETTPPPMAARNLAMLHIAIHDAVNSVIPTHHGYLTNAAPAAPTSAEAAAVGAAHRVLINLFPSRTASFDAALANWRANSPSNDATERGLQLGRTVADVVLDSRSADGSSLNVPYIPGNEPGAWRRTPPYYRPPELPHWRYVEPFALPSAVDYRPPGPPALSSAEYASDMNQVKSIGAASSVERTDEQAMIARFWSDFSYTVTPPGHWNEITQNISTNNGLSLPQNARLFALVNIAMADAGIAVWDAKYHYNFWRPVTAIQEADMDGNAGTVEDPEWMPALNTPAFPEYVSGHSAFSAASAAVLRQFLGTDTVWFTVQSDSVPGVSREFFSLAAAVEEISMSRVWGGIHFLSGCEDGVDLGDAIGRYVERNLLLSAAAGPTLTIGAAQQVSLTIDGVPGSIVVLETSTNLVQWTPVATNTAPCSIQHAAAGPARFFRARQPR